MKNIISKTGAMLVELGKSLMLPIAVLPIAGLLLRFGQPDMLNIPFMAQAGSAVFDNLAVIFALGVAVGFSSESHGAAALSAFVGYVVMTAGMKTFDKDIDMGVFGGILIGVTAGLLYNKYKSKKLPPYLAFFGGRRFVPIVTGFTALVYALVLSYIWPPVQHVIGSFGNWIIGSGNIGLFAYGVANRLLIPLGLHHVLNTLIWFQFGDYSVMQAGVTVVKHGDLWRFFAGDPTAGSFMAGFFPVMMFGLPAAACAMVANAYKQNKKVTAGILLSAALTSFLTGITEPIEFAFMFLAFPLYVLHAVLTGLSLVIMNVLQVKMGFTFSAGLFDYLLNYGMSKHPLMLIPVGLIYFVLYYFLFSYAIRKWNLKTPGREDDAEACAASAAPVAQSERAKTYLEGIGGKENIKTLGSCATRLRLEIYDNKKVDESKLKAAGARGIVNKVDGILQVIIGPEAELVADEIKAVIKCQK